MHPSSVFSPREWIAVLVVVLFVCLAGDASSQGTDNTRAGSPEQDDVRLLPERYFVIDSGTFNKTLPSKTLPSPRALVQYYRNFETFGAYTYDLVEKYIYRANRDGDDKRHWWSQTRRAIQSVAAPLILGEDLIINPSGYVTTTGWVTVHEYAHRTRGALRGDDFGFNPDFQKFGDNPYSFSCRLFTTYNKTGQAVWKNAWSKTLYAPPPSFLTDDQESLISAAVPDTKCSTKRSCLYTLSRLFRITPMITPNPSYLGQPL